MSLLDSIFNYNERVVLEEIARQAENKNFDEEQLSDIACLALNMVPAKYIKHSVDRAFYTGDEERSELEKQVREGVSKAIEQVASDAR